MVSFSVSIFILSLVASGLSVSLTHSKYDNITVNDDVHNLLTKLLTSQQDIGNAINGFSSPGGTLTQALAIHKAAELAVTTIKEGTAFLEENTPLSESDAVEIITSIQASTKSGSGALSTLVDKEPAISALNLLAIVGNGVGILRNDTNKYTSALVAAVPEKYKADAQKIQKKYQNAFQSAVGTYSYES